jgi:O-methyltransferase domain
MNQVPKASVELSPGNKQRMLELISGSCITQVIHAFAELSVADELASGPAPLEQLSKRLNVDSSTLRRLLRAGSAVGLVSLNEQECYIGTPLLELLRGDSPDSMRAYAMAMARSAHWLPWGRFVDAIRSGKEQTVEALGCNLWGYYQKNPEDAAIFGNAMQSLTRATAGEAAGLIETSSGSLTVDVGGASGTLVLEMMERNPTLKGIVFDLPHVIPSAQSAAKMRGLENRFNVVAGDFFVQVPPADIYTLKHILHNWDDAACIRILRNCREALNDNGRVVIIELAIGDSMIATEESVFSSTMDLNMLVLLQGRGRTQHEYSTLLEEAGLRIRTVKLTASVPVMKIIEAAGV